MYISMVRFPVNIYKPHLVSVYSSNGIFLTAKTSPVLFAFLPSFKEVIIFGKISLLN
jgi:hypothetical protein